MYSRTLTKLLTLAGEPAAAAKQDAAQVYALENQLAEASLTLVAMRDPSSLDHPMSATSSRGSRRTWAGALLPHGGYRASGDARECRGTGILSPSGCTPRERAAASVAGVSAVSYSRSASPWLSTPFVNERFAFTSEFTGAKEQLPRWKRCLRETDAEMVRRLAELRGEMFPPSARERARQVIEDIRTASGHDCERSRGCQTSRGARALEKLSKMENGRYRTCGGTTRSSKWTMAPS